MEIRVWGIYTHTDLSCDCIDHGVRGIADPLKRNFVYVRKTSCPLVDISIMCREYFLAKWVALWRKRTSDTSLGIKKHSLKRQVSFLRFDFLRIILEQLLLGR